MARIIETEMLRAIREKRDAWKKDNTTVVHGPAGTTVLLHGHAIAFRHTEYDAWKFNLCGWNTNTTRSRINAIAREYGHDGVGNVKGKPYSNNALVPESGWF